MCERVCFVKVAVVEHRAYDVGYFLEPVCLMHTRCITGVLHNISNHRLHLLMSANTCMPLILQRLCLEMQQISAVAVFSSPAY